jgi:hypothetical protein
VELVEDAANLYWTSKQVSAPGVYYMPKVGGTPVKVASGTAPSGIAVRNGSLYWSDQTSPTKIMKTVIGGSWITTTLGTYTDPWSVPADKIATHIQVSDTNVYFISGEYGSCSPSILPHSSMRSVSTSGGTVLFIQNLDYAIRMAHWPTGYTFGAIFYTTCGSNSGTVPFPKWVNGTMSLVDPTTGIITNQVTGVTWSPYNTFAMGGVNWTGAHIGDANGSTNFFITKGTWFRANKLLGTPNVATAIATEPTDSYMAIAAKSHNGDLNTIEVGLYGSGSPNFIYSMRVLAVDQGSVSTLTMDDLSVYWIFTDVQGDHIRKAAR